ncbi:DUF305 domain-containing protein [Demequina sp. SO4-13]|uniref:DUF305 domain-containing protein n=1 Tax=Demequina sp. SO4-13 TaxID=3401027 RepID=UPI003AF97E81
MRSTKAALAGMGVVVALLVTGCADATEGAATDQSAEVATPGDDQAYNGADLMFAQMMIVHHEGAIEMADLAVERTDSPDVRTLSESISAAQGPEIETMESWLEDWGVNAGPMDAMDHMGHGGMDMGGLSQDEAMDALEEASGDEFDRLYLELMIAHHEGAVEMAQLQTETGESAEAIDLAQQMIEDQLEEIDIMERMLDAIPE